MQIDACIVDNSIYSYAEMTSQAKDHLYNGLSILANVS